MENNYLNVNLKKNITFGLSWLFPVFAIILFVLANETLTREEKRTFVTIFVCTAACAIPILGIVSAVFMIIAAVKAFMNQEYEVPFAPKIADKFLK